MMPFCPRKAASTLSDSTGIAQITLPCFSILSTTDVGTLLCLRSLRKPSGSEYMKRERLRMVLSGPTR